MAKSRQSRQAPSGTAPGVVELIARNGRNMEAAMQATQAFVKGTVAINEEAIAFLNARLDDNLRAQRTLAQCSDPGDFFRLQYDFGRAATEQYLANAARMMDLTTRMLRESWAAVEENASEAARTTRAAG